MANLFFKYNSFYGYISEVKFFVQSTNAYIEQWPREEHRHSGYNVAIHPRIEVGIHRSMTALTLVTETWRRKVPSGARTRDLAHAVMMILRATTSFSPFSGPACPKSCSVVGHGCLPLKRVPSCVNQWRHWSQASNIPSKERRATACVTDCATSPGSIFSHLDVALI